MKYSKHIILFILMVVVVLSMACGKWFPDKKTVQTEINLPEFSLKDPQGKTYSREDIIKNGAVFVITAPTLKNKKDQEEWAKYLTKAKHSCKGRLIFIQDMSPSSFKGIALNEMKKKSNPDKEPLLLIDPKGDTRSKLGVKKDSTIVMAYNKEGIRVHEGREKPSYKSASQVWKSLDKI